MTNAQVVEGIRRTFALESTFEGAFAGGEVVAVDLVTPARRAYVAAPCESDA